MQLSPHFTLEELSTTTTKELIKKNFEEAVLKLDTLKSLANNILEPIRLYVGKPITITSGYRGPTLNATKGGSSTSQHLFGEAVDFIPSGYDLEKLYEEIISGKVPNLDTNKISQIILETRNGSNWQWIHIAIRTDRYLKAKLEQGKNKNFFETLISTDGKSYHVASEKKDIKEFLV